MKPSILLVLIFLIPHPAQPQAARSSELFATLRANDSLLFSVGFNTCDLGPFENLVSDDFEFYHDRAGMTTTKAEFIRSIREGIRGGSLEARRELIDTSLVVHALYDEGRLYGAIQSGAHRFFVRSSNGGERPTSVARFSHLRIHEARELRLRRVLSYDNQEPDAAGDTSSGTLFIDRRATERWLADNGVPALGIGYIEEGRIREVAVYGELERDRSAPIDAMFNVASLTKPVTALVALKRVSLGAWILDRPLSDDWVDPDVADDPRVRRLTTRHVLSHTTGLPN